MTVKKTPKFQTVNTKNADIVKLLEKIDDNVRLVCSGSDFEKRGLNVASLKQHLAVYENIGDALQYMPAVGESHKDSFKDSNKKFREMVKELDESFKNEQLEFKKDIIYMATLGKAQTQIYKNILNLVGEVSPECYYALKAVNEVFTANMGVFTGHLNKIVDYIREIKHNEHKFRKEAIKNTKQLIEKVEILVEENDSLKRQLEGAGIKIEPKKPSGFDKQVSVSQSVNLQRSGDFALPEKQKIHKVASQRSYEKTETQSHSRPNSTPKAPSSVLLTLVELRTILQDVVESKKKYDDLCDKLRLRYETMKTFMRVYLNDKYSTAKEVKDFRDKFEKSINSYARQDINVLIFRSVYENIIDEEFFNIVDDIKHKLRRYLSVR